MTGAAEPHRFKPEEDPYRWAVLGGIWLLYFCFGVIAAAMAPRRRWRRWSSQSPRTWS